MKPCLANRKQLAWLALGELDTERAESLRAHIQSCPGCRQYFAECSAVKERLDAADTTPDIQASDAFHQRLTARLRAEQPVSVWETWGAPLAALRLRWRVALPLLAVAALLLVMLPILHRPPAASTPAPATVQTGRHPNSAADLAPTIANYQRTAARSLDELDELLTRQANESHTPARSYTASMFAFARASEPP